MLEKGTEGMSFEDMLLYSRRKRALRHLGPVRRQTGDSISDTNRPTSQSVGVVPDSLVSNEISPSLFKDC